MLGGSSLSGCKDRVFCHPVFSTESQDLRAPETIPTVRKRHRPSRTNTQRLKPFARIACYVCPIACLYLGNTQGLPHLWRWFKVCFFFDIFGLISIPTNMASDEKNVKKGLGNQLQKPKKKQSLHFVRSRCHGCLRRRKPPKICLSFLVETDDSSSKNLLFLLGGCWSDDDFTKKITSKSYS